MAVNNISKTIEIKNVASNNLFNSEEFADVHFLFRCYDDIEGLENQIFGNNQSDISMVSMMSTEQENIEADKSGSEIHVKEPEPLMKRIPAHKIILAAGSPVFNKMFFGELKEDKTVEIVDVSMNAFTEFLQFFYLNQVTLTYANAGEVIYCGSKYDVPHVMNAYKDFLHDNALTQHNVCSILKIAVRYEFPQLISKCEGLITSIPNLIFRNIDFIRCDRFVLKQILVMDQLDCSEITVFNACMNWAMERQTLAKEKKKFTSNTLKDWLGDCWHLIRFPTMTIQDFTSCIKTYKNYFENDEIANIMGFIVNDDPFEFSLFNKTKRGVKTNVDKEDYKNDNSYLDDDDYSD